jgi:GNAT superfamily N-acetyltransferase
MAAVTVEPFLPRHAAATDVAAWCEVFGAGQRELSGSSPDIAALTRRLRAEDDPAVRRWAARDGADAAVIGVAELRGQPHEPGLGFLRLFVVPPARRRGTGSALLARAARDAPAAGVDRIQGTVLAGPPGEPFARARGDLRVVLRLRLQEQRLDDEAVLRRCRELAAAGPAPGYRLALWRGPAPESLAASIGRVLGHVLDAPGAALQLAPRQWGTAAVRAWEAGLTAGGEDLVVSAAVHLASGEAVAATVATVPPAGGSVADQHDTAVLPAHRRRGLARWLKAEQTILLRASFPAVRAVTVTLNQQNLPMAAVNGAVGYRAVRERLLVELELP